MYERMIEIQERQAAIAQDQTASRERQDAILSRLVDMLGAMSRLLESRTHMFDKMNEGIEAVPTLADKATTEIVEQIRSHLDQRARSLVYWMAAATFLGSLLGNSGHSLIDWLFKLAPR